MPGVTTTSQIDQAVRTFLAESRYTLQERPGVVKSSIRVERLPENQGPSVNIPKYGTVTTYALTEGVDMTQAQQITDTLMTLTPTEFGAQVILSDMMLMESKDEFFRVAGRILADSFDRQQDQTLCDDFDNFSILIGAAGDVANLGHLMSGHAKLKDTGRTAGTAGRGGEPAPDPIHFVQTPTVLNAVAKAATGGIGDFGATSVVPDSSRASFEMVTLPGVRIHADINLNKDASDDVKGGMYSREATILAVLGPEADAERERDASLRGWEVNFVGRWARGEYNDAWGLEAIFDATPPTT